MFNSNIINYLLGGTLRRELAETKRSWEAVQQLWRVSPFGQKELSDFALEIALESVDRAGQKPIVPVIVAACEVVESLLWAESIGDISPIWDLIEADIAIAVEFRQIILRRRRWCAAQSPCYRAFKSIVVEALCSFYARLPTSCFEDCAGAGEHFDVPLIDLIEDPGAIIDGFFMLPYADASFRLDLFEQMRDLCVHNMLIASGFRPDINVRDVEHRVVRPPQQKHKTGAELAELYLTGSPLKALLNVRVPFQIPDQLRFEHCHIIGGTGHGKTQLMQKMIHADLLASKADGRSIVVIDSQGDLISKLTRLDLFNPEDPDSLAERLVVVDPSDVEFPTALNLFDAHLDRLHDYKPVDRERVLNGVIELYETFFGAFLGAELTQKQGVIFKYLARLMLAIPDATIFTLMEIMEDGRRFQSYIDLLDGSARHFFEAEFFHPSFSATKKQVLRRLWGVLSTPAFERMFTQPKNKIDLFDAMNCGKIVLINTAKDLLKRDGSQLFGRFFVAMLTQAALERSTIPEYRRTPVYVYLDEAQEYFDDSIETILNQARKYRVGLTLAHQTLDQLAPRLRSALFSNTSFKCVGGVSAKDARSLADELRTSAEFIEGMKRHGDQSEFAVWVKHLTGKAIRLSIGLGHLERQPTLTEEAYHQLLADNRTKHCGTLTENGRYHGPRPGVPISSVADQERQPAGSTTTILDSLTSSEHQQPRPSPQRQIEVGLSPAEARTSGKGGAKHRYLQSLAKELAEAHGLKATIEAPLSTGGQVDVTIERDGILAAIEISVSTPLAHEQDNLRKCLAARIPRIGIVLAKSRVSQSNYRNGLLETISETDRERVVFLTPEELPDFIASVSPPPDPQERIVRGYRVKGSLAATSPEEARMKREALARLIARSLSKAS